MQGMNVVVTGANSGVGFELTRKLLEGGARVAALVRSGFAPGNALIDAALGDGRLRVYRADFSDVASLSAALALLLQQETRVDVLFNNAGVSVGGGARSKQGRELNFEVNTVAPYLITLALRPLLRLGSAKTVINTSSNALLTVKRFDSRTLENPTDLRKLFGPYATSKLALSLWTRELAPRLAEEGIQIRSVCPGPNKTPMSAGDGMPGWLRPLTHLFFSPPSHGAARLYDAAFGAYPGTPGGFINKGKDTPLRFTDQAGDVLAQVDAIYQRELADGIAGPR